MEAWLLILISVIVAFVGGFFFHKLPRVGSRLVYQSRAVELIGKVKRTLPKGVEILYKNESIPRLMRTYIILWNSGKATLDGEKIVQRDKLRLEFSKDTKVLRVHAVKKTRQKANKFRAEVNPDHPNEVIFRFDYLDEGDGVTLEILHTDKEGYPQVKGNIRGLPKGISNWGKFDLAAPTPLQRWSGRFIMLFLVAITSPSFITTSRALTGPLQYFVISIGGIFLGFSVWLTWKIWQGTSGRIPNSLRIEE